MKALWSLQLYLLTSLMVIQPTLSGLVSEGNGSEETYWVMSWLPTLKRDILITLLRCLLIQQTALPLCWAPLTGKIPWSMACWTIRLLGLVLAAVYQPWELSLPSVWPCLSLLSAWIPPTSHRDCLSQDFFPLPVVFPMSTIKVFTNFASAVVVL